MPFNYLELQPQIKAYALKAARAWKASQEKLDIALDLLHTCALDPNTSWLTQAAASTERCALPTDERIDTTFSPAENIKDYFLLASDGSQIIPSAHDAVPLSLINTSRISMKLGSAQAPAILVQTKILENSNSGLEIALMSEDLINLQRDVAELEIFQEWERNSSLPVITLRDGTLELFHQPRQGRAFEKAFDEYRQLLKQLAERDFITAAYIDRPRATSLTTMLDIYRSNSQSGAELKGLPDILLMGRLLKPGERSAIFELHSSSSQYYQGDLRVHFFYLNVGRVGKAYIVRVEIPAWVALAEDKVNLLQQALLTQCRLMTSQPYPYLLHRAHEEAVVHFDEKEQLQNSLSIEMQREGLNFSQSSNKQTAKALQTSTRM